MAMLNHLENNPPALLALRARDAKKLDPDAIINALSNNGNRFLSKKPSINRFESHFNAAFNCAIDITTLKTISALISKFTGCNLKARGNNQRVRVGFYEAPETIDVPKLLFRADRIIRKISDPTWRAIIAGAFILTIHPLTDGNGRLARYYWIRGLQQLGCDHNEIMQCLERYYGGHSWLYSGGNINAITALASTGDITAYISRWNSLLKSYFDASTQT